MFADELERSARHVDGTVATSKKHRQNVRSHPTAHKRQATARLKVVITPVQRFHSEFRNVNPLVGVATSVYSKCDQQPGDVTESGQEGVSTAGAQPQPAASNSDDGSRGVRWLDREVRSGKVAKEKLLGSEDTPPPQRTDRILRSYSMAAPRQRRRWWKVAAMGVGGAVSIATGTVVTGCGVGLLLACIRSGTVVTACAATYTGTKCIVGGVDLVKKAVNEDRDAFERGTAARVWGHMLGAVATVTATAATVPLANFLVNLYSLLLRVSRGSVDDVRFQLQSRKLLVHSADQVHRASRRVFGDELPQSLYERVTEAMEIAERHFDTFRVESLTRKERNQFLAALGLKLPLSYAFCAMTLCLPAAAAKVIAPLVTAAAKRLPKAINNACLAVERRFQRHLGPPREALAPFLAAAGRVAIVLMLTKPWGLLGERIASAPTLRLRYRPDGVMRVLAGTDFPEFKVPGLKPGQLLERDVSSAIPWAVRYFLQ